MNFNQPIDQSRSHVTRDSRVVLGEKIHRQAVPPFQAFSVQVHILQSYVTMASSNILNIE